MYKLGNYWISIEKSKRTLFVEKGDETFRVIIPSVVFTLERNGTIVTFKRHKHCGQWKWSDSRVPGSQDTDYIIDEVARMLFKGKKGLAIGFLKYGLGDWASL